MVSKQVFLEPDWSISRAGCYELFKIVKYTGQARTTTYDCLCLRCGTRHVLQRQVLMRLNTALKKALGPKGIRYWLQVHGTCPNCTDPRPKSPAPASACISYSIFVQHKLDALGFQLLVTQAPGKTVIQICDRQGKIVMVQGTELPGAVSSATTQNRVLSEGKPTVSKLLRDIQAPARLVLAPPMAGLPVEDAIDAFLIWMREQSYTGIVADGRFITLRCFDARVEP